MDELAVSFTSGGVDTSGLGSIIAEFSTADGPGSVWLFLSVTSSLDESD